MHTLPVTFWTSAQSAQSTKPPGQSVTSLHCLVQTPRGDVPLKTQRLDSQSPSFVQISWSFLPVGAGVPEVPDAPDDEEEELLEELLLPEEPEELEPEEPEEPEGLSVPSPLLLHARSKEVRVTDEKRTMTGFMRRRRSAARSVAGKAHPARAPWGGLVERSGVERFARVGGER